MIILKLEQISYILEIASMPFCKASLFIGINLDFLSPNTFKKAFNTDSISTAFVTFKQAPNIIIFATCAVIMNLPSMKFVDDVVPGGHILVNSSLIDVKVERDDVEVTYIPAK